ncbi:CheR family methyltransferase, partial [Paraburkholderia sp. SIMBA_053]|uniref:CheR family methyltransferase n=1 Tax=Paraburkholderia sp. SIMBA_053 TaxID=3085794 RepID=UPI003978B94C
ERSFQLVDSLRQWVSFRSLNLLAPSAEPIGGPFDVILFRNVSIYFDEATRRQIQRQLKQLLAPKGILLCGVTETLGNDLGVLSLVDDHGIFYFQADNTALPDIT